MSRSPKSWNARWARCVREFFALVKRSIGGSRRCWTHGADGRWTVGQTGQAGVESAVARGFGELPRKKQDLADEFCQWPGARGQESRVEREESMMTEKLRQSLSAAIDDEAD